MNGPPFDKAQGERGKQKPSSFVMKYWEIEPDSIMR